MTTKEVAQICGVTEKTVRENAKTFGKVFENGKPTEWTEEELKKVQLVLMKNAQNNNANASEQVKDACTTVFQLGTLANVALTSGNIEAAEQFSKLLILATTATAQAKQLEEQNQLLLEQKEAAEKETARIYQCNRNFHNSLYTASDIAKKLGITPNMVGRIANENGATMEYLAQKYGIMRIL